MDITIKEKVIDETYAFHGKAGIECMIDMIKNGIFNNINNKGNEYYKELYEKLVDKLMKKEK